MKLYNDAVLEAAASREAGDSVGAWRLADALLAAIPSNGHGGDRRSNPSREGVETRLQEYAEQLAAEGIETPGGGPYSARSLENLRDTAMAWSKDDRYPEAAFRTHQEAGSPGSDADVALKALCKYAGGGVKRRPSEINADAWKDAVALVDNLVARKAKYTVSANALRTAIARKNNTFTPAARVPGEPVTAKTAAATVRSLPPKEREELVKDLVSSDPVARRSAEQTTRSIRSEELAEAERQYQETHAGKRQPTSDPEHPERTVIAEHLATFGILVETEGYKDSFPKIIKIVSDQRDVLEEDDFAYLREWSAEVRRNLDILDELLKLGQGLTDEALEHLLKGD